MEKITLETMFHSIYEGKIEISGELEETWGK
jgi:hypothetical protein